MRCQTTGFGVALPTSARPQRCAGSSFADWGKAVCLIGDLGEFIGAGDKVINYGTMSKTPTEPACDWVAIWTLDEGMIRHCWMVMDTATAFLKLKRLNPKLVLG